MSVRNMGVAVLLLITTVGVRWTAAGIMMSPKEGMSVVSMSENAGMIMRMLYEIEPFTAQPVSLSANYSETGWSLSLAGSLNGKLLSLSQLGTLAGDLGETIACTFSSAGFWGTDPITNSGQTVWYYDATTADYSLMHYDDSGQLGTGSTRWVVRGAELLVGAGGGGWLGGWAGAFTGALAAWTISDIAFEIADSVWPPPPERPAPPSLPPQPDPAQPPPPKRDIKIIQGDNNTVYNNNGNVIIQSTSFNDGSLSGTIAPVPEPSSMILLALGLASAVVRLKSEQ